MHIVYNIRDRWFPVELLQFEKIEQRTIEKEIVGQLRNAIISGKLGLGVHLPEMEIAEKMAVSRIPIREALRQLEQEGLVYREPNRGSFVITFTEEDVREVFSLRATLENMSFDWAVHKMSERDLRNLDELIEKQHAAIASQDFNKLADLDMQFHEYIVTKADHSRLLKCWYEQHAQCQMLLNLRFMKLAGYTPETVVRDHAAILESLRVGDVQKAKELTLSISDRVSKECISSLEVSA
jgi:DNA-binding GntR family transcriptional regulator